MFTTTKALTDAQEALASMTAERDAEIAKVAGLNTDLATATAALQTAEANLLTATTRITALEGEKLAAENALAARNAEFDAKIAQGVIERCAAAGLANPIAQDPNAGADKTLKRADFDKLDHSARSTFITSGGKLTD